ncbi:helix-turn-helix transcriptional regulator [Nocardioides ultimimeridianus]
MDGALERRTELAAARAAYDDARGGLGSLLLVTGPAGIGKSTLLERFGGAATGLRTLRARADELETDLPFGVVRQLFEGLLRGDPELAERMLVDAARVARAVVLPSAEHAPVSPQEAAYALTWLVANLAAEQPLLLLVDDLAWADDASSRWLRHLAARLDELPVVVAASLRTGGPRPAYVADLLDVPRATELPLEVLSAGAVAELVRAVREEPVDDAVCVACAEVSAGNPFLVHELLRSLRHLPRLQVADVTGARPDAVARSVGRRLGGMSATAQRVAEVVAVLGEGAELRHAAALAGLDVTEAAAGADELAEAGILAPTRPLSFVHPLVRTATYDRLGAQARAHAHAAAARMLAAEGADTQQVAKHLLLAPPLADGWAAGQLFAAGGAALMGGAAREAHTLLARALLEPPPAELRASTELALAQAELRLLDPRAEERLEHVLASGADVRVRAQAASALTSLRILLGRPPAPRWIADVLAQLPPDESELALDLRAGEVASGLLQYAAMPDAGRRTEALATGVAGATPAERRLLGALAYHLVIDGRTAGDTCAELAVRALGGLRLIDESGETAAAWLTAMVLLITGRHREADDAVDAGLRRAADLSSEASFATWSVVGCYAGWLAGRLGEAEAHGQGARRTADRSGLWLPRVAAAAYLGRVLVDRDELDAADALLGEVAGAGPVGNTAADAAAYTEMLLRAEQGRWTEVVAIGEAIASRGGGATNPGFRWRPAMAVALDRLGDRAGATELLAEQRAADECWGIPRATGLTLLAEGLVEQGTAALERIEQAVEVLGRADAPLELARALLAQGRALRHDRQRAAARPVLAAALDLADRCGALRLAGQAEQEIASCGGVVRRRRTTGPAALTPSELRVARMAAEGLTNVQIAQALFVTRKTVESQLTAVYRKLGVSSRQAVGPALEPTAVG